MAKYTKSQKNVYNHLTLFERETIAIGIQKGLKQYEIAKSVGKHPSTISREIKRNSMYGNNIYRATAAQWKAECKRRNSHNRERIRNRRIRNWIIMQLKDEWTPEQIAGRIGFDIPGAKTNYETIYQYIYKERRDLIKYLAKKHRIRQNRAHKRGDRRGVIPNKTMIDERPSIVERRTRTGDWEFDTMVSRQSKASLAVLRERVTHYVKIERMPDRTSEYVKRFMIDTLKILPRKLRRTVTMDNGFENAQHQAVAEKANIDIYFCNPYHSWEKGSVENTNGLIRRYFPKKTDFNLLSDYEIMRVERKLNKRPRKSLGFKTPAEMFKIALGG